MIDKREFNNSVIGSEFDESSSIYWFDFKRQKFLHNIDTFYYSVKLHNDLTVKSADPAVLRFRSYFKDLHDQLGYGDSIPVYLDAMGENLNLLSYGYGKYYDICLECPDYFHIFMASKVPPAADGEESVTCEIIVQIRSYMLWMFGVHESFERSLKYVQAIVDQFGLSVDFVQENRIDYCWHSNYLSNPEKFFTIENFYKMRVDRYSGANYHTAKVGSEDYEIDYISLGNRGGKCFVRIYMKSKEVVEQGYKAFFFKVWLFHGLINRYDLFCYEEAYIRRSWKYVTIARLDFYRIHGLDVASRGRCVKMIEQYNMSGKVTDNMIALADHLTPKVHLVTNVEYQTMRKGTKSYELLPVRDNSCKGAAQRVYDYLDNRPIIIDYLTRDIFRLVESSGDVNKSRRDDCGFWRALRKTKCPDMKQLPDELTLTRNYNRDLNSQLMKRSLLNKVVVYGFYTKGINDDAVMKDCMNAILKMNDNDLIDALRYKKKKARQFSAEELAGTIEKNVAYEFVLMDRETGSIYDDNSTTSIQNQDYYGGADYE